VAHSSHDSFGFVRSESTAHQTCKYFIALSLDNLFWLRVAGTQTRTSQIPVSLLTFLLLLREKTHQTRKALAFDQVGYQNQP
jgi:hypothetical protein